MPFRAGMFVYALLFMLGILIVQQLSLLPGMAVAVLLTALLLTAILLLAVLFYTLSFKAGNHPAEASFPYRYYTLAMLCIILIYIGFIYAVIAGNVALSKRLDESLTARNILVTGLVSGIPKSSDTVQRFEFKVISFHLQGKDNLKTKTNNKSDAKLRVDEAEISNEFDSHPKKIRLSWYYGQKVNAGERWQFQLRLKPPHGFMNPGGFDYEAWLFQQGFHATGYVRKSELNKRLRIASTWSVDRLRHQLSQQLDQLADENTNATGRSSYSLVKALAIGDKSAISMQQWKVLTNTGTSHLMAISGLHIGLASLFAYVLIRRLQPESLMKRMPSQHIALIGGFLLAALYALLAGLSIPTQRAIIMLFAITVMMLFQRNTRPVDTLGFALLLVLLVDPLAVMSVGFWFSFSAVAVIFISLFSQQVLLGKKKDETCWWRKPVGIVKQWVRLQLIISVFLLPLSLYMFQQGSLVSPLANLLLIPYVSFLVVPVVLVGLIFSFISLDISQLLFSLAEILLDFIWPLLEYFSQLPFALWQRGNVSLADTVLATLSITLLFFSQDISSVIKHRLPKKSIICKFSASAFLWSFRLLLMLMFMPMFSNEQLLHEPGEFQLTVLDVGQGSSAIIRTKNHLAIFDAGAKFSDSFNAGSGVVIPYLRSQGVAQPRRLIISHGDSDHIGGAQALLDNYPDIELYGQDLESLVPAGGLNSRNIKNLPAVKHLCVQGLRWRWDGVDFVFLSPAAGADKVSVKRRNNRSCVLRVSSEAGSVLLTGDIEEKVEHKLVEKFADRLRSDVLVVPHHGSNTSSSENFISKIKPELAVISVAYKNRYGLPSNKILDRYNSMNIDVLQTADSGAITINYLHDNAGKIEPTSYRKQRSRYWHHKLDLP